MGKKITFLLVIVATFLLSLPTQAAISNQPVSKSVKKAYAAGQLKGINAKVKNAFVLNGPKAQDMSQALQQLRENTYSTVITEQAKVQKFLERNLENTMNGKFSRMRDANANRLWARQLNAKAPSYRFKAETKDNHGIITEPGEGTVKVYTNAGGDYYVSSGSAYQGTQSGTTQIVECTDGTVYFKDIVSTYTTGAWVKGTREGNTITVPTKQPVDYDTDYSTTLSVRWAALSGQNIVAADATADSFTFIVDDNAGTISLQGTSDALFMAILWDDDNSWAGFGAFETVYTYANDYVEPTTITVTPPAGLQTETWYTTGHTYSSGSTSDFDGTVKVGFDGNDVYVQGMFDTFPEAWMKGTIDGTTVTFAGLQYQGTYSQQYEIYATGGDQTGLIDYVMTYDATNKVLSSENALFANASVEKIYYLTYITDIQIKKDAPKPLVIDELPYNNALNTSALFKEFKVIDANNDGKTWAFDASNNAAAYSYSSTSAANDWLVSPAIKLEAGKTYRIALDAANYGYPERFEVKLGTEISAAAFTKSVIDATDVMEKTFNTYENALVTVAETGYYYVGIHAISDADEFKLFVTNFVVEAGAEATSPDAVTNFDVIATENKLEATVSFNAPTKAVNGTDLTSNLTKIEILRDGEVIKTLENVAPGAAQSYVDNDNLTMGNHTYQVIPYNEAGKGVKSEEKTVFLSAEITVPTTFDLSKKDVFEFFQVIDANEDDKTWSWGASYGTSCTYNSSLSADDYLVSPAIKLEAGKNYNIIIKARNLGYPERFEVKAGKVASVEGLNITAIQPTIVENGELDDFEGEFSVAEGGLYFLAIHSISDPDMFRLIVDKFTIEQGASADAPAVVENFVAAPGAEGAIEANISFKAPSKAINGNALTEALTKVEILRDDAVVKTLENVALGSAQNWKDENVEQGKTYVYQVIPYNEAGRGTKSEKQSVFIGVDVPADITGISVLDQQTKVTLNWDAVTVGQNGGYVNPAQVEYIIWSTAWVEGWLGEELALDEKLDSVFATTYTLNWANTDEGTQDYTYWGLQPRNAAGEGDASVASLLTGAPYELPFTETFAGKSFHSLWDYDNVSLYIYNGSSDGDEVALNLQPGDEVGEGYLLSGKINLNNAINPTLLFDGFSDAAGKLSIIGFKPDNQPQVLLAEVPFTNQFSTVKVPLASIKDARYNRVAFFANFVNATDSFIIDNIRIVDLYEHDLAVNVKAAKGLIAGDSTIVKVTVENKAENAAQGYTVKLTAGDKELLNVTPEAIPAFSSKEFTTTFKTSIFDEAADIVLKAQVIYTNDLNPDNNTDETILSVKEPTATAPENFLAKQTDDTIELSWTTSDTSASENTESFEDQTTFVPFGLGGITATEHTGAFGDWTVYDGNGITVYGFNNLSYENMGEPQAWAVFNPALAGSDFEASYEAYNGEQFLWSFCPVDESGAPKADHWLISPELTGVAQTIKFFYRVITEQYGAETFEVLYSTTDKNPQSFTKVKDASVAETSWTEYSFDIPEGAKYFAIRHTSEDIFGLLIDDITFTSVGKAPVSFNIYVDAVKQASTTEKSFSIEVDELVGSHVFGVSAVYENGAESKVVTATVDVVNAIQSIITSGKPFSIYTLDGKLISKQATSLKGLKGAYVIDNKKVVLK